MRSLENSLFAHTKFGSVTRFSTNTHWTAVRRPLEKSEYLKMNFPVSVPKHMLWVLKRTVSMRRVFLVPKTNVLIDR